MWKILFRGRIASQREGIALRHRPGYVRVRRNRPGAAFFLVPLAAAALFVFIRLGLPALPAPAAGDGAPAPSPAPAQTREVALDTAQAHLVILGRADGPEAARVEAARFVSRGAAGYVFQDGGVYQVAGACYESREEADAVAARLIESGEAQATAATYSAGPARLRITAPPDHLAALTGAEALVRSQLADLGAMAFSLDAGEDVSAVRAALYIAAREAQAAGELLQNAAGETPGPVAGPLLDILRALTQTQEALAAFEAKSPLFFSSKMKYNQIDLRMRHLSLLRTLSK